MKFPCWPTASGVYAYAFRQPHCFTAPTRAHEKNHSARSVSFVRNENCALWNRDYMMVVDLKFFVFGSSHLFRSLSRANLFRVFVLLELFSHLGSSCGDEKQNGNRTLAIHELAELG